MKNKIELKKYLIFNICLILFLIIGFNLLNKYEYDVYKKNTNNKISAIINTIETYYKDVSKLEIINILNSEKMLRTDSLQKYGIDLNKDSIIMQNDVEYNKFKILKIIYMLISLLLLTIVFLIYLHKKSNKIKEITKLINKINNRIYTLVLNKNTEDELSILESELYKTMILLKEQAENSIKDKTSIKGYLDDISHQLKTPLTTINLCLDNLIENESIDEKTKNEFLHTIKREISNMNFLIISILKLSKFETNTVEYEIKSSSLYKILEKSYNNISMLCDLKNIKVYIDCNKDIIINCDPIWQAEAITNILKNAVEHSKEKSTVSVIVKENKVYTSIKIENTGLPIDKKDLPHIFERFYKGKNSSKDSIGIGLALSKSIIEKNGGKIKVECDQNKTIFTVKYFK